MTTPPTAQQPTKRARFSPPDVPSLISSLQNLQARAGKKLVSSNVHIYAKGGAFVQPEDRDQRNGDGDGDEQPVASGSTQAAVNQVAAGPTATGSQEEDISRPYVADPNKLYVTSWKMSEHHYRRADCPFPTLARGLFTANEDYSLPDDGPRRMAVQETEGKGERIVGRGYDKFFNVGEVDWTKVGPAFNSLPFAFLPPHFSLFLCVLTRSNVIHSGKPFKPTLNRPTTSHTNQMAA